MDVDRVVASLGVERQTGEPRIGQTAEDDPGERRAGDVVGVAEDRRPGRDVDEIETRCR